MNVLVVDLSGVTLAALQDVGTAIRCQDVLEQIENGRSGELIDANGRNLERAETLSVLATALRPGEPLRLTIVFSTKIPPDAQALALELADRAVAGGGGYQHRKTFFYVEPARLADVFQQLCESADLQKDTWVLAARSTKCYSLRPEGESPSVVTYNLAYNLVEAALPGAGGGEVDVAFGAGVICVEQARINAHAVLEAETPPLLLTERELGLFLEGFGERLYRDRERKPIAHAEGSDAQKFSNPENSSARASARAGRGKNCCCM